MKTKSPYTTNFKHYGQITVPAGTATAMGVDPNYHFVNDLSWIDMDYPSIANILKMDIQNYGLNVPVEFIQFVVNGYKIAHNDALTSYQWQVSHDEIGMVGDFKTLEDAIEHAEKG